MNTKLASSEGIASSILSAGQDRLSRCGDMENWTRFRTTTRPRLSGSTLLLAREVYVSRIGLANTAANSQLELSF
jgi:hypothetical protein